MRIIFHTRKLSLISFFAVQIYLNYSYNLSFKNIKDKVLSKISLNTIPSGTLIFIEKDIFGNSIFILERENRASIICQFIMGFTRIINTKQRFVFYDLTPYDNKYISIANKFNKNHIFKNFSLKVELFGVKKEYKYLYQDISNFYKEIEKEVNME
jgi:hypothetical protein